MFQCYYNTANIVNKIRLGNSMLEVTRLYARSGRFIVFSLKQSITMISVCAGAMFSGEYDVCGVTLSVHPHRAS